MNRLSTEAGMPINNLAKRQPA
jgi:hypothetical protein